MLNKWIPYVILTGITTGIFWLSNSYLQGSMASHEALAKELQAPPEAVYEWNISQKAPFNYRVMFPLTVNTVAAILPGGRKDNDNFFRAYYFTSLLFMITAVLSFYFLINRMGYKLPWRLLGIAFFVTAPAFLMAYTLPVHTREDMLGYTLLIWGLLALTERKRWLFLLVAILGVWTRETLMLLPFLYFFFSEDKFISRLILAILPAAAWLGLRIMIGLEHHDLWLGLRWNFQNLEQVIGFCSISFHALWVPFFVYMIKNYRHTTKNQYLMFLTKSAPWVLVLVISTTFLFGIFNEIRLLFLMFPWVIILTLQFLYEKRNTLKKTITDWRFLAFAIVALLLSVGVGYGLATYQDSLLQPSRYGIPYDLWIMATLIYGGLTVISLPLVFQTKIKE